jgi:hypothetical protein
MDQNLGARGGQWGAIKIEYTVDLGVLRESGVEATRSHQIEGEN